MDSSALVRKTMARFLGEAARADVSRGAPLPTAQHVAVVQQAAQGVTLLLGDHAPIVLNAALLAVCQVLRACLACFAAQVCPCVGGSGACPCVGADGCWRQTCAGAMRWLLLPRGCEAGRGCASVWGPAPECA